MVAVTHFQSGRSARFLPPAEFSSRNFTRYHVWLPFGVASLLLAAIAGLGIDQRWADTLYAWEGHRWALRGALLTEFIVHRTGHAASIAAWCLAFAAWLISLRSEQGRRWRKPLGYLVLSTLLATGLVAWVKSWSNMDCPWDLVRYGGDRPFVGLLGVRPVGLERGLCFPAAHAGAGYAWFALYFFFGVVRPERRYCGLFAGLAAGLLFGFSQQLRGAHFVSHDIWSAGICWATVLVLYRLFWPAADALEATASRDPQVQA